MLCADGRAEAEGNTLANYRFIARRALYPASLVGSTSTRVGE